MDNEIILKHDFSCLIEKLRSIQITDSRDDIKHKIRSQLPELIGNLALIFLCPEHPARNHWAGEVIANILPYNGLKNKNNKLLRPATYYDFLWKESVFVDSPTSFDELLETKFKKENINLTKEMTENTRAKVENFMKWLATELSKEYVTKDKIYEKLGAEEE